MIYFCFLESSLAGVQYMQPLDAQSADGARSEAATLLRYHDDAYAAHVFAEDQHVATVRPADVAF